MGDTLPSVLLRGVQSVRAFAELFCLLPPFPYPVCPRHTPPHLQNTKRVGAAPRADEFCTARGVLLAFAELFCSLPPLPCHQRPARMNSARRVVCRSFSNAQ